MNPYDRTAAEMKRQSEGPKRLAKTALNAGLTYGTAAFAPTLAKAAPFLSQYIPEDLAIKGLTKIHPKLGAFVKRAVDSGYDWNEAKNFLGKQIEASQESKKNPKEDRNIIEQYSPELHQFIDQEVKKGRNPLQAGAIAQNDKRFSDVIKKLTKDHKTPWSSILESVYGALQQPNESQEQQNPQQPQQAQPGKGEQALMGILNELNQKRRQM